MYFLWHGDDNRTLRERFEYDFRTHRQNKSTGNKKIAKIYTRDLVRSNVIFKQCFIATWRYIWTMVN